MNLLGRRSLSSFFKVLLDVAFYAACLAGALLVVVAVLASRTDNSNVSISLPVRFEIDPSVYRIQGANGAAVDARIEDAGGKVGVTNPSAAFATLPLVGVIAVMAVLMVVLHRLRRIFRRLVEGRPFLDENARSLRFMASRSWPANWRGRRSSSWVSGPAARARRRRIRRRLPIVTRNK
jgi:hypothetical protein